MSTQSMMDRFQAAKFSVAGQGLAKVVCKATTEEIIGPKKKHLDYLLQCTSEPNVSIPQLANLLIERTQHPNWVVVFKSLISVHNLMNYGNERFTQYLASNNCTFNLGGFMDKTAFDMSTAIRRYAKYLNQKAFSYRQMAFDFCKVKRGKDDGLLRTMNTEKLLKALPCLQQQIDTLIEFDTSPNELTNGVMNAAFLLLFKDLIRLFACYNDGIINLLEKYFDMNKKQCKEGLEIYKRFLVRMDKVSEFLRVAENVGIDKGDIPDLAKGMKQGQNGAPASLLDALEQHLAQLEGKKAGSPPGNNAMPAGFSTALNTISSNSTVKVSDEEKKRILEEENNRLQQLKEQRVQELTTSNSPVSSSSPPQNNPFTPPASTQKQGSIDLFGPNSPTSVNQQNNATSASGRPSDDLLNMTGNPFMESVQNVMATAYSNNNPFGGQPAQPAATNSWATNGNVSASAQNSFTTDADFAKAFNNTSTPSSAGLDVSLTTTTMGPPTMGPTPNTQDPFYATSNNFPVLEPQKSPEKTVDLESPLDPYDPKFSHKIGSSQNQDILGLSSGISPALDIPGASPMGMSSGMSPGFDMPVGSPMGRSAGMSPAMDISGASPMGMGMASHGAMGSIFGTSPSSSPATGFHDYNLPPSPVPQMGHMSPAMGSPSLGRHSPAMTGLGGGLGDLGQLGSLGSLGSSHPTSDMGGTGFDAFGDVLQPLSTNTPQNQQKQSAGLAKDLDASLVQLAGNLNIKGSNSQIKKTDHQWQPKGEQKLTGGTNFAPRPTSTGPTWNPQFQQQQNMMGGPGQMAQPRMGYGAQGMQMGQPMMGMQQPMGMPNMGMGVGMGMQPPAYGMQQPMGFQQPRPPTQQQNINDPFGAL